MAEATAKQKRLIYSLGRKCGLVQDGNKQDDLHAFVYQLSCKESIAELTEQQASVIIRQLMENLKAISPPEEPITYISQQQIKKIFGLMYDLEKISPSTATVKERLCGLIKKELELSVNIKGDIFKGMSERQGAKLIEALKRYQRTTKRRIAKNGTGG